MPERDPVSPDVAGLDLPRIEANLMVAQAWIDKDEPGKARTAIGVALHLVAAALRSGARSTQPRCDGCGGPHELNYWVADDVWEQIRPDTSAAVGGGGALCLSCIDVRCAEAGLLNVPVRVHFDSRAVMPFVELRAENARLRGGVDG